MSTFTRQPTVCVLDAARKPTKLASMARRSHLPPTPLSLSLSLINFLASIIVAYCLTNSGWKNGAESPKQAQEGGGHRTPSLAYKQKGGVCLYCSYNLASTGLIFRFLLAFVSSSSSSVLVCHPSRTIARQTREVTVQAAYVSLSLSLCLSVCLSICLSVCLSLSLSSPF